MTTMDIDDSIIGDLREEIKRASKPKPIHIATPEEYEAEVEYYKDLRVTTLQPEVKEYILRRDNSSDKGSKYDYFLDTEPTHVWQWPLLIIVRSIIRISRKFKK